MARTIFKLINSFKYSRDGFVALCKEQSFRLDLYSNIVLIPLALLLPIAALLKLILIILLMLLLVVEALNSAIEAVVDRISLDIHIQSKLAKDMGSTAVGVVILMNIIAWIYALYSTIQQF